MTGPWALVRVATCLVAPAAAATIATAGAGGECIKSFSSKESYFPDNVQLSVSPRQDLTLDNALVQFAGFFEIEYGTSFKVLLEKRSKEQYVLVQCGAVEPTEEEVDVIMALPENYTRKRFAIPLGQVATESSLQLGFFEVLGLQDRVRFVAKTSVGACWQKAAGCNGGYEGAWGNATKKAEQDAEVEAIFTDCYSDCSDQGGNAKTVHFSASQDPGPLHTAEHVKFLAAFFNKEREASAFFDQAVKAYEGLRVTAPGVDAPKVAWVAHNAASEWSPEAFVLSLAFYKHMFVTDAGGLNVDAAAVSSANSNFALTDIEPGLPLAGQQLKLPVAAYGGSTADAAQALWAELSDVDVVIDETYASRPQEYTFESFLQNFNLAQNSTLPFIANKKVFRVDRIMSAGEWWDNLDWFESRLAHPHWVLQDLAGALRGQDREPRYLRNVVDGEGFDVITQGACAKKLPCCREVSAQAAIPVLSEQPGDDDDDKRESAAAPRCEGAAALVAPLAFAAFGAAGGC